MNKKVLTRYRANPILNRDAFPIDAAAVFNPGATKFKDEYILMTNITLSTRPIVFWIARSKDGISFTPDPGPVKLPNDPDWPEHCVYDPRITKMGEEYFICHASTSEIGVRISILKTRNFKKFKRVSLASQIGNRNAVLFPEKINGMYAMLDRPFGSPFEKSDMWISYSPDLIFWGKSKIVMKTRNGLWDENKIGAGAVPIKTPKGWLELYHGVAGNQNSSMYNLGAVILDLDDPSKVIARTERPILYPEMPYEINGRVRNIVFTCNALLDDDGETIRIYYGASDESIGLAMGKLSDIIDACF